MERAGRNSACEDSRSAPTGMPAGEPLADKLPLTPESGLQADVCDD